MWADASTLPGGLRRSARLALSLLPAFVMSQAVATARPQAPPVVRVGKVTLRYVTDEQPGIQRVKVRDQFRYLGPDGKAVRDRQTLKRIKSLVIPPAWSDVWIC